MPRAILTLLGGLLVVMISGLVCLSPAAAAWVPTIGLAAGHQLLLNFRNVDIRQLITLMSDLTGKTFLVHNAVRGTVTLVAPRPLSRDEAYQVFLAVLYSHGFTAVPQGPIVKIIPARKAKSSPLPYREP